MEWGSINGEFVARKKKFSKTSTAGGTDDKCLFNRSVISIYPRVVSCVVVFNQTKSSGLKSLLYFSC